MKPEIMVVLMVYLGFGLIEFVRTSLFTKPGQTKADGWLEVISTISLLVITQPLILLASAGLLNFAAPQLAGSLSHLPFLVGFALFIVFDDMMQYWWHRASHTFPILYKLHRPHHNAEYMSVRLVYRNNIFYYATMPGLWLSGALIYMGLGWVYAVYLVIKLTFIIGAHSDVCWDRPLYKIKALDKVMWVVERTFSTPATHHAHHGRHKADGVTNYKGNFGNMLFLWDVIFGTAKITREYPPEYGVENLAPTTLGEQVMWPIIRASASVATQDQEAQAALSTSVSKV
jgi:sterol desaturase/sphingolipid hydroxylase (fatty acid hydroxylase superfamily)